MEYSCIDNIKMKINIKKTITIDDGISGNSGGDNNSSKFQYSYTGSSDFNCTSTTKIVKDFKIENVEKRIFSLSSGNTFDKLICAEMLGDIELSKVTSVHIFCYETTKDILTSLPVKFDVTIDESDITIGSMSEFSMGNIKNLTSDIRINNIVLPAETKANLVIIISTK